MGANKNAKQVCYA